MATALTSELTRFTDKCNNVLAGGTVKTFEPNSLISKITYQDPLATIPNPPEVNLDETGRAKIYIKGDYRIQVYSRDGVLIEDDLLVEQTLVQRDFTALSQEIQTELQQALDQFQIESTTAVDNLYDAIASIGGMVEDGQFKLDWTHVFNKPTTVGGYGITNAYTKSEANSAFIEDSEKGTANGVATLGVNAKVPVAQLPAATDEANGVAKIATSAIALAGTNDTDFLTPLKLRNALNVTGVAPMFPCRARVNFNGTGAVAIRNSGNVSSITDNGVGRYNINFTIPMPNADYSYSGSAKGDTAASDRSISVSQLSTDINTVSTIPITVAWAGSSQAGAFDSTLVSIQVFC